MFLDPQPLRPKQSGERLKSGSPSPFFSAPMPDETQGDQRWRLKKRKAVDDLTASGNDHQRPEVPHTDRDMDSSNSTIRLVTQTPSPPPSSHHWKTLSLSSASDSDFEDIHTAQEIKVHKFDRSSRLSSTGDVLDGANELSKPRLSGFPSSNVSDPQSAPNNAPKLFSLPHKTLQHTSSIQDPSSANAAWHYRSGSSGNYSNSSTLQEATASTFSFGHHSWSNRYSQGTTLQGTPTPTEQELRKRIAEIAELDLPRQGPAHALETLQESSPERATIRPVPSSNSSSSSRDRQVSGSSSNESESSLRRALGGSRSRSHSASNTDPVAVPGPTIPPRRSSRRWSSPIRVAPLNIRKSKSPPQASRESLAHSEAEFQKSPASSPNVLCQQESRESIARSEATLPLRYLSPQPSEASLLPYRAVFPASSPIVAVFDSEPSDLSPARPGNPHLRFTPSIESIQSRLSHPLIIRPPERALTTASSWSSLRPSSADDIVPPLYVPKKRQGKRPASLPLGSESNLASGSSMDEEVDTLPYPRQPFTSHLSTIASESDRVSEVTNRRSSHFSLGSGVLTVDEGSRNSSLLLNSKWVQAHARERDTTETPQKMSSDESETRTSGIYREGSAVPQPLFKAKSPRGGARIYDGPLPPMPPIPLSRDSDENFDTVSDLPPQSPALRPRRSGYSLRRRSNSTPSHSQSQGTSQASYVESDRGSYASSLFPTWAKHFYGGTGHLLSASRISMSSNRSPRKPQRQPHVRTESQWTERSITSRLGTGYGDPESSQGSPMSSHFLPSIFRPRTRRRTRSEVNTRSAKSRSRRSRRSRPSADIMSRPDSMAILQAPPHQNENGEEILPSGQPKYGRLNDASPSPERPLPVAGGRPLPRKYSRQKDWNNMEFPRPMTKDRLSDFHFSEPHLPPTRRSNRLSNWRPPSFVESLDTLVRSRCNRQVLLFCLGFICPVLWIIAAFLPLPHRPASQGDLEKAIANSQDDVAAAMMKHEAGDAERRWRDEKQYLKGRWWRTLNRIMSVIGVLVIAAVVSLAVVVAKGVGGPAGAT